MQNIYISFSADQLLQSTKSKPDLPSVSFSNYQGMIIVSNVNNSLLNRLMSYIFLNLKYHDLIQQYGTCPLYT